MKNWLVHCIREHFIHAWLVCRVIYLCICIFQSASTDSARGVKTCSFRKPVRKDVQQVGLYRIIFAQQTFHRSVGALDRAWGFLWTELKLLETTDCSIASCSCKSICMEERRVAKQSGQHRIFAWTTYRLGSPRETKPISRPFLTQYFCGLNLKFGG